MSLATRTLAVVLSTALASYALTVPGPGPLRLPVQAAVAAGSGPAGTQLGSEAFWSLRAVDLGSDAWTAKVNTFTGNLHVLGQLAAVPGRGPDLRESLAYNGQDPTDTGLGAGWLLGSSQTLTTLADGSVVLRDGEGTRATFTRAADGSYTSPPGVHLTLTDVGGGTQRVRSANGGTWTFSSGVLVSSADESGNALRVERDAAGRTSALVDASGRSLAFAYDAAGRLAGLTDPAGRSSQLGYDASGRLASVTSAAGAVTSFGYGADGRLSSLTNAVGGVTRFEHDAAGALTRVLDARSTAGDPRVTSFAYDSAALVTTVTDPAGGRTSVTHNAAGNPVQTTDPAGITTSTTWRDNLPVEERDARGSASSTYDARGNLTSTSETVGAGQVATTSVAYDGRNNPTSVTDPSGRRVDLRYDPRSNLTSAAVAARREADANTYDGAGNVTSVTDPGAGSASLVLNGSFEHVDAATGVAESWVYGGTAGGVAVDTSVARHGQASLRLSAPSAGSLFAYSHAAAVAPGQLLTLTATGRLSSVTGAGTAVGLEFFDAAGAFLSATWSNSYTGTGQVPFVVTAVAPGTAARAVVVLDHTGSTGTAWLDGVQLEPPVRPGEGFLRSRFDYVSNSSFEAGGTGWAAGGVAGSASVTTTAWGGQYGGQLALTSSGTSTLNSRRVPVVPGEPLTLSGVLRLTSVTGSGARVQVQYYDGAGTLLGTHATGLVTGSADWTRYAVASAAPAGSAYAIVFAALFNGTGTVNVDNVKLVPRATTTYGYAAGGNDPVSVVDPLGARTTYTYDANSNLTSSTDPTGARTTTSYDAADRPVSTTDALGRTTWLAYDAVGSGTTVRDARSASAADDTFATHFGYDALKARVSLTDPLTRTTTYDYDRNGRLVRTAHASGRTVSYAYDGAGRPLRKALSDGPSHEHRYDAAGNLTEVTDSSGGGYGWTYDAGNRLVGQTTPTGYALQHQRDASGAITSTTDSDGRTTSYQHGSDGRLLSVTDPSGRTSGYRYDDAGRPFQVVRGDGLQALYTYDDAGRPTVIADPGNPGGGVLFYGYDSRGNVVTLDTLQGRHSYAYDALSRLTSWTSPSGVTTTYAYDAVGNLVRKGDRVFAHDAAGQLTGGGFTHDADGNLTSDGTRRYAYDAAGRLVQVTRVSDGSLVARYRYDHEGLRIEKTTPAGTVRYDWDDQDRLVRETDAAGTVLARYTWSGPHQLAAVERGGQVYYPHTNARGDVLAMTDASGRTVATYQYGPWGEPLEATGTLAQPWRYAGYYLDDETGLYYLQQRYYSAELGRFLSEEPMFSDFCADCGFDALLDNAPTTSPYAYADNRPVHLVDPDGRAFFVPLLVAGAIRVGAHLASRQMARTAAQRAAAHVATRTPAIARPVPRPRVAPSRATRQEVYKRDGFRCQICGVRTLPHQQSRTGVQHNWRERQLDHIIRWRHGGGNQSWNLRTTCRRCNNLRG